MTSSDPHKAANETESQGTANDRQEADEASLTLERLDRELRLLKAYVITHRQPAVSHALFCGSLALLLGIGMGLLAAGLLGPITPSELTATQSAQTMEKAPALPAIASEANTSPTGADAVDTKRLVQEALAGGKASDLTDQKPLAKVDRVVDLGMTHVRAVSDTRGEVMFMGEGGRFVIAQGKLFDIWARKELKTIDEMAYAATHLPLEGLGVTSSVQHALRLGQGKENAYLFVDPQCGWCHRLMTEIEANATLLARYTFHVWVVPALGDESNRLAKRLFCSDATKRAKWAALKGGAKAIDALSLPETPCDTKGYDETLFLAQMVGVKGVPYVIAPDGRFVAGKPSSLEEFLAPKRQKTDQEGK